MPSCGILIGKQAKVMTDRDGISCGNGQRWDVSLVAFSSDARCGGRMMAMDVCTNPQTLTSALFTGR